MANSLFDGLHPEQVPIEMVGRFAITDISPSVLGGRRPAAAAVHESIPLEATCFREGHDSLGAHAVLHRPDGSEQIRVRMRSIGLDRWQAMVRPDAMGDWSFSIEAWGDPWGTWLHRARIKIPADVDVELELAEGALLLDRACGRFISTANARIQLQASIAAMRNLVLPVAVRLSAGTDPRVLTIMESHPLREQVTVSGPWPLAVQRRRALVGSWYEFFPRSETGVGACALSGTFATAASRLPAISEMGFNVVYLPPIHPIGRTHRKGPNNTLSVSSDDPGSPWAIGSPDGGHDAVHPDLGTLADFDAFVAATNDLGMEIALDLALQASPDHPWVTSHPEWFTTRADGTIAYAENPPKTYQDIYPLNFDNDPAGIYREVEGIVRFWMSHGVRIFRVDNPHTKPLWLWEGLIASIRTTDPDVFFLAEAFTAPNKMKALAEVGFQQNYTYFTWRTSRDEIQDYGRELAGPASAYMRPNFFTNTPDILHEYLQKGGPNAFAIRLVLAATLAPSYGIYSGYELFEHLAIRPGSEEYLNSEKFQYHPRDWEAAKIQGRTLAPFISLINRIRNDHAALQDLRSLRFHSTNNPQILAFSKRDGDDMILVVCTLDPHAQQEATVWWDMEHLGFNPSTQFVAHDLVTETTWTWGHSTYIRLTPWEQVAHIAHLVRP